MPLAVALLSISNPSMTTMDTLSRLSHDSDQEVAQNAVIALGAYSIPRCRSSEFATSFGARQAVDTPL